MRPPPLESPDSLRLPIGLRPCGIPHDEGIGTYGIPYERNESEGGHRGNRMVRVPRSVFPRRAPCWTLAYNCRLGIGCEGILPRLARLQLKK